jgi:hypothetical protein
METIHLDDFLDEGLLRESSFREKVDQIDWSKYSNKRVMIKGCADIPIPTWAYLILTAQLAQYVERIYFGELRSAIKIFIKDKD